MTTTTKALTKKQERVLHLLQQGMKPAEVAKRLKIGRPAVYNHMRSIRRAGVTLPGEELLTEQPPAATNGNASAGMDTVDTEGVAHTLQRAIATTQTRLAERTEEEEAAAARLEHLRAERENAARAVASYEKALAALNDE